MECFRPRKASASFEKHPCIYLLLTSSVAADYCSGVALKFGIQKPWFEIVVVGVRDDHVLVKFGLSFIGTFPAPVPKEPNAPLPVLEIRQVGVSAL